MARIGHVPFQERIHFLSRFVGVDGKIYNPGWPSCLSLSVDSLRRPKDTRSPPSSVSRQHYRCPHCGVLLESAQDVRGRPVQCRSCQTVFTASVRRPETVSPQANPSIQHQPASRGIPRPPIGRKSLLWFVVASALVTIAGVVLIVAALSQSRNGPPPADAVSLGRPPSAAEPLNLEPFNTPDHWKPGQRLDENVPTRADGGHKSGRVVPEVGLPEIRPSETPPKPKLESPAPRPSRTPTPVTPADRGRGASPPSEKAPTEPTRPATGSGPLSGEQVFRQLVRSSVLVVTSEGGGTGFVADEANRLVVTNNHVVRGEPRVAVVFPMYDRVGDLVTDSRQYLKAAREVAARGEVLARDPARDLALIRVERLGDRSVAVRLAAQPAPTGASVYSVGGSGADDNLLWRLSKGTVRGRAHRKVETDGGTFECIILETDAPVNKGDSGGPVMNDRGELVAVTSHFLISERQVSGSIDVEEVRKFIRQHRPGR